MDDEIEPLLSTLAEYDLMPARERYAFPYDRMTVDLRRQICERDEETRKQREAEEMAQYRREAAQLQVNTLPQELLKSFDVSKHPNPSAHSKVMAWAVGKRGLMLVGPTGMAKSRSLLQLLVQLIWQDTQIVYWSAPRLADKISAVAFESSDKLDAFIRKLELCPVLAVDDLGAHKPTERVCQEFHRVIDTRYSEGLPILVTTNCNPAQLQKQLLDEHGRTIRRLQEITEPVVFSRESEAP
jgi:DNA replication protein DnaC